MTDPADGREALAPGRSLILLGVAVLVLASPLRLIWARDDAPSWLAFALALGLVALAALATRRPRRGR